jgi:hypothetical protein
MAPRSSLLSLLRGGYLLETPAMLKSRGKKDGEDVFCVGFAVSLYPLQLFFSKIRSTVITTKKIAVC